MVAEFVVLGVILAIASGFFLFFMFLVILIRLEVVKPRKSVLGVPLPELKAKRYFIVSAKDRQEISEKDYLKWKKDFPEMKFEVE